MKKDRKKLGKHDWSGSGDPSLPDAFRCETFSVGIFQWVATKSFSGLKRGKVVLRIKGDTTNPQPVYDAAETWCDWMDKGRMPDFKTLNMGFGK